MYAVVRTGGKQLRLAPGRAVPAARQIPEGPSGRLESGFRRLSPLPPC